VLSRVLPAPGGGPVVAGRRVLPADAIGVGLGVGAAVGFGVLLPRWPLQAVALVVLLPLAFAAPVASLGLLLSLTLIVPFDLQNEHAFIGGEGVPGLLIVDLLLLLGLIRVGALLARGKLRAETPLLVALALGAVLALLLAEGIARGADVSDAGHEARRLALGVGTFVLAWPILLDQGARRRLYGVLMTLGLALGLWGLAQWLLGVEFTAGADVGIRPGVEGTVSARGSLQGGLYAFPVAVTLAFAAVVSGRIRSPDIRWLVIGVLLLNGLCLLLTYERTFWAATVVACAVVALRSGPAARRAALRWGAVGAVVLVALLTVLGETQTAVQRLVTVVDYGTDQSLEYRKVETRNVLDAIAARPVTGSGLGATITWGKQGVFGTQTTPFSHNGYAWLAWKLGLPVAILLLVLIGWIALRRAPPLREKELLALRAGSQAALLALLLIGATFPPFNAFGITAAMGLLAAVALQPRARDGIPGPRRG
jgi:hypothetical protein